MTIFELLHITDYLDIKHIGYFSTMDSLKKAIQLIRKQPGFNRFPHNFFTIPREVVPPIKDPGYIYEAGISFHDREYVVEGGEILGVFGQEADAENSISLFCQNNTTITTQWLLVDSDFGRCELDKSWWTEGFDSVSIQKEEGLCNDTL